MTKEALEAADVLRFWREAGPEKWFRKDEDFDREVNRRFGDALVAVAAGAKDDWGKEAEGALALIILLDQFSRNIHRGTPKAFAQDAKALKTAHEAIARGFDRRVEPALRMFFLLPFEHSESIVDQERGVSLAHALNDADTLFWAREHERIIRRFGRFPHRNRVLGRHTTPAEEAFLAGGGFAG